MTYEETIDWLYSQLPMFSRIGAAAYKKDLHNTLALCQFLNNPQHRFKSIHIAGTNGKGSTSHMLAAIFQQCGYKTGLYTSPHIHDFRERIRINGEMVSKDFVKQFVERCQPACAEIEPSFFELTVAMAFEYFAQKKVDIAIIETGLGGRLDSTNVITPVLSVITQIGFDHMALLGDTLPKIASEKAGIIKPQVPVVIGESLPETKPVFVQKAHECLSDIHFAEEQMQVTGYSFSGSKLVCSVEDNSLHQSLTYTIDLGGLYQQKNLCTVLTSVKVLQTLGYKLRETKVSDALFQVKQLTGLKGRWDQVSEHPAIILDVAHNKEGIREVLQQLKRQFPNAKRHFILGFVQDKDISGMLKLMDPADHYYFTQAQLPRALPHEALQDTARAFGLHGMSYPHVDEAIAAAKRQAQRDDVIMICGSFFVIAEITGY